MKIEETNPVVLDMLHHLDDWLRFATILRAIHIILGIIAVGASILVASKMNSFSETTLEWLAFAAAVSVGLQTGFDLGAKANQFRNAWRLLKAKYLLYKVGGTTIEELVRTYEKAEEVVGDVKDVVP